MSAVTFGLSVCSGLLNYIDSFHMKHFVSQNVTDRMQEFSQPRRNVNLTWKGVRPVSDPFGIRCGVMVPFMDLKIIRLVTEHDYSHLLH